MTRRATVFLGPIMVLALGPSACMGSPAPESSTPPSAQAQAQAAADPAALARLADALEASPDRAEAILREAGFTEASFESAMIEVAADPALTEAFMAARGS